MYRAPDIFGALRREPQRRFCENQQELLSANAGRNVTVPDMRPQDRADFFQNRISGAVAKSIVDPLEMVDVHLDYGDLAFRTLGAPQLLNKIFIHVPPVEQSSKRVSNGLFAQVFAHPNVGERETQVFYHRRGKSQTKVSRRPVLRSIRNILQALQVK